MSAGEKKQSYLCHSSGKVFFLRDPITGYTKKISLRRPSTICGNYLSSVKSLTTIRLVFVVCSKSELTPVLDTKFAH